MRSGGGPEFDPALAEQDEPEFFGALEQRLVACAGQFRVNQVRLAEADA